MKLKINLKKTSVKEVQEQLDKIEKKNYQPIIMDYTSLYPSFINAKFDDEFLRRLKIQQRKDKLKRILDE